MELFKARDPEEYGFKEIIYEKKDWVATVTINRPDFYNAYNTPCLKEMITAFTDAHWDDKVGVVIFTGAGDKAFCTGGDVKEYAAYYTQRPRDYVKYSEMLKTGNLSTKRHGGGGRQRISPGLRSFHHGGRYLYRPDRHQCRFGSLWGSYAVVADICRRSPGERDTLP